MKSKEEGGLPLLGRRLGSGPMVQPVASTAPYFWGVLTPQSLDPHSLAPTPVLDCPSKTPPLGCKLLQLANAPLPPALRLSATERFIVIPIVIPMSTNCFLLPFVYSHKHLRNTS